MLEAYVPPANLLAPMAYSFSAWLVFNYIVMSLPLPDEKLKYKDKIDLRNRMVSFVHGLTMAFLAGYQFYFLDRPFGTPITQFETNILVVSFTYFFYDFAALTYYGILDPGMIIHHSVVCLGMYLSLCLQMSASEILAGLYISEISNPMMHGRIILKHLGRRFTKLYEVLEFSYIGAYIYGRLFLGAFVVYGTVTTTQTNIVIRMISVLIALQSYFYISKMVGILQSRYRDWQERKQKGIKLNWLSVNKDVEKLSAYQRSMKEKEKLP